MIHDMLLTTSSVITSFSKTKHVCYIRMLCVPHGKHSPLQYIFFNCSWVDTWWQ